MRIEFDPLNRDEATAVRLFLDSVNDPRTAVEHSRVVFAAEQFVIDPKAFTTTEEGTVIPSEEREPATDNTGTPWDARIHSTPAVLNKDGTWRAKRGVSPELVAEVKRELEDASGPVGVNLDRDGNVITIGEEDLSAKFEEEITLSTEAPPAPLSAPTPPTNASTQNAAAPTDGAQAPVPSEAPPAPLSDASAASGAPAPTPPPVTETATSATTASPSSGEPSFLDVMKAVTAVQKDGKMATPEIVKLAAAVIPGATSTMALNGKENGPAREAFLALLAEAAG